MNRSKRVLVTCHCALNANAKIYPLASVGGVFFDAISSYVQSGCGLFQLPCPELSYLGVNRWGMTKEQYDHPNFRTHCQKILKYPIFQIQAMSQAGYEVVGIVGMNGSPNCGVTKTCEGYSGGEICSPNNIADQMKTLRYISGQGVFIEELVATLKLIGLQPELIAIDESQPV